MGVDRDHKHHDNHHHHAPDTSSSSYCTTHSYSCHSSSVIKEEDHPKSPPPKIIRPVLILGEEELAIAVPIDESTAHPITDKDDLVIAEVYNKAEEEQARTKNKWKKYGGLWICTTLLCIIVVIVVSVVLTNQQHKKRQREEAAALAAQNAPHPREQLGIREYLHSALGGNAIMNFDIGNSPYTKAVDWILFDDPQQLTTSQAQKLVQRTVLASFYYQTTTAGAWKSCNPPNPTLQEQDYCMHELLHYASETADDDDDDDDDDSFLYESRPASRWLSGSDECHWAGIICIDSEDGSGESYRVVSEIHLDGNELTGPFPTMLIHLPHLMVITLGHNQLQGRLFAGLASHDAASAGMASTTQFLTLLEESGETSPYLKELQELDLRYNEFIGSIPALWWSMRHVRSMDLAGNQLQGPLPPYIANLADSLESLFLEHNDLTGPLPTEMGQLAHIRNLRLSDNDFTGALPASLGDMTRLEVFEADHNLFTGTLPATIGRWTSMIKFQIAGNRRLTGPFPEGMYNWRNLIGWHASECNFTGTIDSNIGQFTKLYQLHLDGNAFLQGAIPVELHDTTVEEIKIQGTGLTGSVPVEICSMRGPLSDFRKLHKLEANCGEGGDVECSCCTLCCNAKGNQCQGMRRRRRKQLRA